VLDTYESRNGQRQIDGQCSLGTILGFGRPGQSGSLPDGHEQFYLTAQGCEQQGWKWVRCEATSSETPDALVYFQTTSGGEITVRLQAGAEGVGFDQFILSPAKFLNASPSEPIVEK